MDLAEIIDLMNTLYGQPNARLELVIEGDKSGRIQRRWLTRSGDMTFYSDAETLYAFKSVRELELHVRGVGLAPFT